jgi:D-alanyl-D-alanine carboxypeptidase
MSKPLRFASAVSFVALATMIGGCASPQSRASSASAVGSKGEVGLATRALAALQANDVPGAIGFAEQAVAKSPNDATYRALLGNAYFAGGRFASAEAAYKDSLALSSNQPELILKLALVQIGQGKNDEAIAFLQAGRDSVDPADYGLALALAGHPAEAVAVLEPVARSPGADARVRQNLALAYAFSGNWANARAIAAQDVPGNQLDARIHQWMQLATPARPSDQLAALIGVSPAASDPGEPVQLALNRADTIQTAVAPVQLPPVAEAAPPAREPVAEVVEAPQPAPPPFAETAPAQSVTVALDAPQPAKAAFTHAATAPQPIRKPALLRRASAQAQRLPIHNAVLRTGNSPAVVQLGAYGNADRVAAAWNAAAKRFGALHGYTPMSARFASAKGTFYRLSVKGFSSVGEANALCASVRRAGGACFVRNVAGDAPVQFASR